MANLSMELGRGLRWDAEAGKVIGDDDLRRIAATRSSDISPTIFWIIGSKGRAGG